MARTPSIVKALIENRLSMLVYGPPGSGKTILASYIGSEASRSGARVCYAYVSPNKPTMGFNALFFKALVDATDLARTVLYFYASSCEFIVVDPINYFYRMDPSNTGASILALVSALLRKVGGLATGVYAEQDGTSTASGMPLMKPYFHLIARSSRRSSTFMLEIEKPGRKILLYRASSTGGVHWM